jgi:hypothetical protein
MNGPTAHSSTGQPTVYKTGALRADGSMAAELNTHALPSYF